MADGRDERIEDTEKTSPLYRLPVPPTEFDMPRANGTEPDTYTFKAPKNPASVFIMGL
jgi:hypothetical protein